MLQALKQYPICDCFTNTELTRRNGDVRYEGGLMINSMENRIGQSSSYYNWDSLCSLCAKTFGKDMNLSLLPTAMSALGKSMNPFIFPAMGN